MQKVELWQQRSVLKERNMDVIGKLLPWDQKFLSYMAFSVYEVVDVTRRKQTNYATRDRQTTERLRKR